MFDSALIVQRLAQLSGIVCVEGELWANAWPAYRRRSVQQTTLCSAAVECFVEVIDGFNYLLNYTVLLNIRAIIHIVSISYCPFRPSYNCPFFTLYPIISSCTFYTIYYLLATAFAHWAVIISAMMCRIWSKRKSITVVKAMAREWHFRLHNVIFFWFLFITAGNAVSRELTFLSVVICP